MQYREVCLWSLFHEEKKHETNSIQQPTTNNQKPQQQQQQQQQEEEEEEEEEERVRQDVLGFGRDKKAHFKYELLIAANPANLSEAMFKRNL